MTKMLEQSTDYGTLIVDVEESQVVRVGGDGLGPAAVSGIWGFRADYGNWNGELNYRLNWNIITPRSLVYVAAGEGASAGGPADGKFIGGARFSVANIAPAAGFVLAKINVQWSTPVRVYLDFLVINP